MVHTMEKEMKERMSGWRQEVEEIGGGSGWSGWTKWVEEKK